MRLARVLLITPLLLAVAWAQAAPQCEGLLDPQGAARRIEQALDSKLPGRSRFEGERVSRTLENGSEIAFLDYSVEPGHVLRVARIEVGENFRRRGLNRLLTAQAVLAEPGIETIKATLAWTNAQVFFDTQRAQPFLKQLFRSREVNAVAVKATPFYKIFAELGFTEIDSVDERGETIGLELSRLRRVDTGAR